MASLNKVMLIGNLGQDPELRYTQSQVPVVTLNLATTESWTKDGQRQDQTEWHRVIVWNKQAENCAKYLSKGRPVYVEGKLQTRSWDDKTGQKRYTTEIVAQTVTFLSHGGQAGESAPRQQNNDSQYGAAQGGGGNGFSAPQMGMAQSNMSGGGDLDDIPF